MADKLNGRRLLRSGVAATALLALLAGCGGQDEPVTTGTGAPVGSAADGPRTPSSAVTEAQALYDDVVDGMRGTEAQTDAVRYLEDVGYQDLIIECMAAKGFTYLANPAYRVPNPVARYGDGILDTVDPAAVEADGLGLDATIEGLIANAKAGAPIVMDTDGENGPPPPEHQVEGWGPAVMRCDPTVEQIGELVDAPSDESGAPIGELVDPVLRGDAVTRAAAGYPECMRAGGWNVDDRHELALQVRGTFEDALVNGSKSFSTDAARRAAQVDQLVGSAQWRSLVGSRTAAASADAACRQPAHDLALTSLLEPLRRFEQEQGAEIERLRAEWAALEQRAARTPDPGR